MAAPPARPHILLRPSATILSDWQSDWAADDDAWDSTSDSESARKPSPLAAFPRKALASTTSLASLERPPSSAGSQRSSKVPKADAGPTPARAAATPIPTRPGGRGRTSSRTSTHSQDHAFSFTHVVAPSPSSYPSPHAAIQVPPALKAATDDDEALVREREQAGWVRIRTIEKLDEDSPKSSPGTEGILSSPEAHRDPSRLDDVEVEMVVGDLELETPVPLRPTSTQPALPRRGKEVIKPDVEQRVKDPFSILRAVPVPPTPATPYTPPSFGPRAHDHLNPHAGASRGPHTANGSSVLKENSSQAGFDLTRSMSSRTSRRRERLLRCLAKDDIDMAELTQISWQGIPADVRPIVWQLLLTYLPLPASQRLTKLHAKRHEYTSLSSLTFSKPLEQTIWHQIEIDVPRTRPGVPLWSDPTTQRCLERILYLWAIRHPASGYVQGINDLVTPFFQVFLSFYIDGDPAIFSPCHLPQSALTAVEADSFWCLSNLLDGIQMNYIHGQPGIVNSLNKMSELVGRIDRKLSQHLETEGVEYMQFAFRWMNCLLMRELTVENTIRMWDTYMCEGGQAFSQFHLFVCTAFLLTWSKQLQEMDFQGMIMFLQNLPTQDWSDRNIEELMGKAWQLSNTWKDAQSHLGTTR